jgi:uncharacterized protein YybS (DUF2232 family)
LGAGCLLAAAYDDLPTVLAAVREHVLESFDLALATMRSMGAPDGTLASMEAEKDGLVTGLVEMAPALVVLTGALFIIANVLLTRRWAGVYSEVNLLLWRTPDALIWTLIAAGFGMFVPAPSVALTARNVFIVLLGGYFCQGLAIVSYYLAWFRLPRAVRIASYTLIAIHQVLAATVVALGIFDLWANFRRVSVGPADIEFRE